MTAHRTEDERSCQQKRMADGKICGKRATFMEVFDHPELVSRFGPRFLCGQHARRIREDRKVKL